MQISQVKEALRLAKLSNVTLALVGVSGSAKTSIASQIYKELGFDSYLILRPSLMADPSDLTGLYNLKVVEHNGEQITQTEYARPSYLPLKGQKVLIVLDEINRVNKEVANALFGMIEAEKPHIGEWELGQGSQVMATLNPPTSNYNGVLDFQDNAWSSRLTFVKIVPTFEDWSKYGRSTGNVTDLTLDFFTKFPKYYQTGEQEFEVELFGLNALTNTRSKEKMSRLEFHANEIGTSKDILFEMIRGIVGKEMAQDFMNFREEKRKVLTFNDVINNVDNVIETFDYNAVSNLNKITDEYMLNMNNTFTDAQLENYAKFLSNVPADLFVSHIEATASAVVTPDEQTEKPVAFDNNNKLSDLLIGRYDAILTEIDKLEVDKKENTGTEALST